MPEIFPNLTDVGVPIAVPDPRSVLFFDGTQFRMGRVDAAGHLQVDVLTIAAGVDVATETSLAAALGQLRLIEDIREALQSRNNDRLIVRGENQLFSIKNSLISRTTGNPTGAYFLLDSATPPANEIWVVTCITAADKTTATTRHTYDQYDGVLSASIYEEIRAFGIDDKSVWGGHVYLDPDDVIRIYFTGAQLTDTCQIDLAGYRMTLET